MQAHTLQVQGFIGDRYACSTSGADLVMVSRRSSTSRQPAVGTAAGFTPLLIVVCDSPAGRCSDGMVQASAGLRSSMVFTGGSLPSLLGSTPAQAGPLPLLAELEERNQQLEAEALQAQQSWEELSEWVAHQASGMLLSWRTLCV
jgi:hypothetical protein